MTSFIPTNPSTVNNVHNTNSTLNTKKNVESNGLKSSKKIAESNIAPKDVSLDLNTTTKGSKDNLNASLDNNANPQNTKISQVKDEKLPSQPSTVASENLTPFKELAFPSSELDALEQKLNTAEETVQAPIADATVNEQAASIAQAAKKNTAVAPQKKNDKPQANKTAGKAQSMQKSKAKGKPNPKTAQKRTPAQSKATTTTPIKEPPELSDSEDEHDSNTFMASDSAKSSHLKTPADIRLQNVINIITDLMPGKTVIDDRVLRWQTKNPNQIRSFEDTLKTPNGNTKVKHYKDYSDEDIKVQRANHFIPGTELIVNIPFYKNRYCIDTPKGCKVMAVKYHNGLYYCGSIGFGIDKNSKKIYHQMYQDDKNLNGSEFNYKAFKNFPTKPEDFKFQNALYAVDVTEEGVIRFTYDKDHAMIVFPFNKKTMVTHMDTDH